MSVDTVDR